MTGQAYRTFVKCRMNNYISQLLAVKQVWELTVGRIIFITSKERLKPSKGFSKM